MAEEMVEIILAAQDEESGGQLGRQADGDCIFGAEILTGNGEHVQG